jgi:NAD(P)H-nitrite reductase large subunit/rubredoxin
MARLEILRMKTLAPPCKSLFKPSECELDNAFDYGRRFGEKLKDEWVPAGKSKDGVNLWKCTVCGEIFEGALPPNLCSVCGAGPEAFIEYVEEIITFNSNESMKVLIVGSGPGAVYAADAVRKRNAEAEITLITKDSEPPYYRPALTKQLSEDLKVEDILIFDADYYTDNNIKIINETEIVQILPDKKEISDRNGNSYEYDKLVLALGAKCFVPPLNGAQLPEVFTLRTFTDFCDLKKTVSNATKITVLGGGLLGLEAAYSLKQLGKEVTVIEMAPRILPRQLDEAGSELLLQKIKDAGINVITGVFVEEISGDIKVRGVVTDRNEFVETDAVIISVGIRSNFNLAADAGLTVNRGIIVDAEMTTSDPDIYAVGDCAIFDGIPAGLWEIASEQGKVAGANIAGELKEFSHLTLGATMHAFDTAIFSVGDIGLNEKDKYIQVNCRNDIRGTYKNIFFKNNKLCGALLVGDLRLTNPLLTAVKKQINSQQAMDNKLL